jgi:hypothetical protein
MLIGIADEIRALLSHGLASFGHGSIEWDDKNRARVSGGNTDLTKKCL